MTLTTKALMIAAALVLAGCQNPDRYGAAGPGGADMAGAGGYIDTTGLGDPRDPRSIAYFNQTVGDTVQFALDQSTLTGEARTILSAQAGWLNQNPGYTAIIEGHADEQGTREYNLALGARRAASVQQYLVAEGVAGNRLRTISYGKERPLAVCSDETCYARNRRGVTVLSLGSGV